jgi:hypothetical protein
MLIQPDWAITMHMSPTVPLLVLPEHQEELNKGKNAQDSIDSPVGSVIYSTESPLSGPTDLEDILVCYVPGCTVEFVGRYRRGNRARHLRNIHGLVHYLCGINGCTKTYRRSDARKKHQQRNHGRLPIPQEPGVRYSSRRVPDSSPIINPNGEDGLDSFDFDSFLETGDDSATFGSLVGFDDFNNSVLDNVSSERKEGSDNGKVAQPSAPPLAPTQSFSPYAHMNPDREMPSNFTISSPPPE